MIGITCRVPPLSRPAVKVFIREMKFLDISIIKHLSLLFPAIISIGGFLKKTTPDSERDYS